MLQIELIGLVGGMIWDVSEKSQRDAHRQPTRHDMGYMNVGFRREF